MEPPVPRLLGPPDIPAAMDLKKAAGWNQTEADWRNVLCLAPEGCFGIEAAGRLASTATAVRYDRRLAWIGMVLTHPTCRGRGFARRLMEHALEHLAAHGSEWIKLDATDMGRPLYRRLGFEDECPIERWGRGAEAAVSSPRVASFALDEWRSLDAQAFGADRSRLLATLAPCGSAAIPGGGYAMARPGANAAYFGPCVSRSPEAARQLLGWFLAGHPFQPAYWDLLPENTAAAELAREFGFAPLRRLVRMVRPGVAGAAPLTHHNSHVYAIAGFEYG